MKDLGGGSIPFHPGGSKRQATTERARTPSIRNISAEDASAKKFNPTGAAATLRFSGAWGCPGITSVGQVANLPKQRQVGNLPHGSYSWTTPICQVSIRRAEFFRSP